MPTDHAGDPLPSPTYHGFAGAAPPPPPRRTLPRLSGRNLAIGTAAVVALGVIGGLLLRPNVDNANIGDGPRPMAAVPIQVDKPAPVTSDGKLEVLSPEHAAGAHATITSANGASLSFSLPAAPPDAPPPQVADARPLTAPPAVRSGPPIPVEAPRPGQDCAGARGAAEAMVCADPDLADIDRDLNRAYRQALQSGAVPPGALRAEQRDWLAIREDAARHSRRALVQVYRQRIEELNDAARGEGPDD